MTFACKKCKKCFRKDAQEFEEADEYCPHCDNHYVSSVDLLMSGVVRAYGQPRSSRRRHLRRSLEWRVTILESTLGKYILPPLCHCLLMKASAWLYDSMLKDERAKQDPTRSLFAMDFTDRVG